MYVVSLGQSSSSDEHHSSSQLFGHRHAGSKTKTLSSLSCVFGPVAFTIVLCLCWRVGWSSTTVLPPLVQIVWTHSPATIFGLFASVNWPQFHDSVFVVQEPETEDPHEGIVVSGRSLHRVLTLWRGRTRQWSPYSRCRSCAGLQQTSGAGGREKGGGR